MKVRCEIDLDLDTGDYNCRFLNLSSPGDAMDYAQINRVLKRVFTDVADRREPPEGGGGARSPRARKAVTAKRARRRS